MDVFLASFYLVTIIQLGFFILYVLEFKKVHNFQMIKEQIDKLEHEKSQIEAQRVAEEYDRNMVIQKK